VFQHGNPPRWGRGFLLYMREDFDTGQVLTQRPGRGVKSTNGDGLGAASI
jgi:hypothetical protein